MRFMASRGSSGRSHAWVYRSRPLFPLRSCAIAPRNKRLLAQARTLAGPYLVGADGPYVVPYLSLADVNGDGHADLLLLVREEVVVYINEHGTLILTALVAAAQ